MSTLRLRCANTVGLLQMQWKYRGDKDQVQLHSSWNGVLVLTPREDVGEWVDGIEIILVLLGTL